MKVTAPPTPSERSLPEILAAVRMAHCGKCRKEPGNPCAQGTDGADGDHVARYAQAMRRGLISGNEFIAVVRPLGTIAMLVYTQPADGAR